MPLPPLPDLKTTQTAWRKRFLASYLNHLIRGTLFIGLAGPVLWLLYGDLIRDLIPASALPWALAGIPVWILLISLGPTWAETGVFPTRRQHEKLVAFRQVYAAYQQDQAARRAQMAGD